MKKFLAYSLLLFFCINSFNCMAADSAVSEGKQEDNDNWQFLPVELQKLISQDSFKEKEQELFELQQTTPICYTSINHKGTGILQLAYNPNGSQLAVCADDKTVQLLDIDTDNPTQSEFYGYQIPYTGTIKDFSFHPQGEELAIAEEGISIIDLNQKQQSSVINSESRPKHIVYSQNGSKLAWTDKHNVYIVNPKTNQQEKMLAYNGCAICAFSPDNTQLALGNDRGCILWNIETNEQKTVCDGHIISDIVFNRDGSSLIFSSVPNGRMQAPQYAGPSCMPFLSSSVSSYELDTERTKIICEDRNPIPSPLALSNDGAYLVTHEKNNIILWDIDTFEKIQQLEDYSYPHNLRIAYRSDGNQLASIAHQEAVRLWNLKHFNALGILKKWLQAGCPIDTEAFELKYEKKANTLKAYLAATSLTNALVSKHTDEFSKEDLSYIEHAHGVDPNALLYLTQSLKKQSSESSIE